MHQEREKKEITKYLYLIENKNITLKFVGHN